MDFETLWYELFPYLCGVGGIIALLHPDSLLLRISGTLLIVAALTILRLRWVYRRSMYLRLPTPGTPVARVGPDSP